LDLALISINLINNSIAQFACAVVKEDTHKLEIVKKVSISF